MAKFYSIQGTTNQMVHVFVQSAGATNGAGVTGLSFSASGFTMAYIREGQAAHSLVTKTGSGNLGTYVSGNWLEVSPGTMPGVYEFHVPNAAVTNSGGAGRVVFIGVGNASMAPVPFEIQLDPSNSLFTPILAATTHSGATIPIVSTVARVLLADTCSTVARTLLVDTATRVLLVDTASRVLLADTVSTVARALLVDTATVVLNVNTCTNVLSATVATYAAGQNPSTFILATTANKLVTDATGFVTVGTNGDKTGYRLSVAGVDDILDDAIGDSTVTVRQALKAAVAALAGKLSGAGTTTVSIRNVADDTNVIVATVDATGNRSAVTLTL